MISSPIDEIKNRLDIVEVIGSYLKLQKTGANYRALCPFHTEKTPSFFVSPARQIWHCFGSCSTGGDIFKFVMKIEGVEFGDALRLLAQKTGIQLKKQDPKLRTERRRLYEICELAAKFFEKQLMESKKGTEVKKYLLARGLTENSIKKWRLGYAPDTWQGLSDFLISQGYKREEIVKAGLAIQKESEEYSHGPTCPVRKSLISNGVNIPEWSPEGEARLGFSHAYDRFRNRIIFPIFDLNSQVIGFGGRIFRVNQFTPLDNLSNGASQRESAPTEAKYINTPNTLLYDKSRVLYGLDKAKLEIRKKDFCVIVEGYIDVIMSAQAGLENVVATSGTALTPYQLEILKRYSKNLLLGFDMDVAGDTATKRGIDLAQTQGFNLKVIAMPPEKDPADIVASSPQDWQDEINKAKDIMDFYFETTFNRFAKKTSFEPTEKLKISESLLPAIKRISNKILQSHWLGELAKKLKAKEEDLETELKKYSFSETGTKETKEKVISQPKKSRQEMLEEKLLCLILKKPKNLEVLEGDCLSFFSPRCQKILKKLQGKKLDKEDFISPNFDDWDEQTRNFLNYLFLRADLEKIEEKELEKEILTCLRDLKNLVIRQQLENISQELKTAEELKNSQKIDELLEKFSELTKQLGSRE